MLHSLPYHGRLTAHFLCAAFSINIYFCVEKLLLDVIIAAIIEASILPIDAAVLGITEISMTARYKTE